MSMVVDRLLFTRVQKREGNRFEKVSQRLPLQSAGVKQTWS